MKKITCYFYLSWLIILVVCCLQSGCANTANGFGRLVSGVGNDIQDMSSAQYEENRYE